MQTIKYNNFVIEVFSDELYSINSADNKNKYEHIYLLDSEITHDYYSQCAKFGIWVKDQDNIICSAIIIGTIGTSLHKKSLLLDDDNLIIIIGDGIFNIKLPDLSLNWKLENENCYACFEIYKFADGYVVHGEGSIFKVSKSGKIEWNFYGRDIFVTLEGIDDFQVFDDYIVAKDWDYKIYRINKNGKEII